MANLNLDQWIRLASIANPKDHFMYSDMYQRLFDIYGDQPFTVGEACGIEAAKKHNRGDTQARLSSLLAGKYIHLVD